MFASYLFTTLFFVLSFYILNRFIDRAREIWLQNGWIKYADLFSNPKEFSFLIVFSFIPLLREAILLTSLIRLVSHIDFWDNLN